MTRFGLLRGTSAMICSLVITACSTATPTPTLGPTSAPTIQPTTTPSPAPTSQPTQPPTPSPTPVPTTPPTLAPTRSPGPAGTFNPNAGTTIVPTLLAGGFNPVTFVTNAGDGSGRLFVVEQRGVIWTIDPANPSTRTKFFDIAARVRSGDEQGLLGLAFHPDFENNGRFFLDYTNLGGDMVISEFAVDANGLGDTNSERNLLTISDPFPNHNGGMLAFGPDGYLYIGNGDGGSGGDPLNSGQSLDTLLGKILRLDIDSGDPYGIPADNPFVAGGGLPEIWDWGVRNPWRYSFDRATGALIIGDVGQESWEEIDVEPVGAGGVNYGWNVVEGKTCYVSATCSTDGTVLPVWTYSHAIGCSVTGGYVYRGAANVDVLTGAYIFSDYCTGKLWAFNADDVLAGGGANVDELGQVRFNVSSFGEDEAGELYIVDLAGAVYRIDVGPSEV
jgi:glucose/arabinose dehydrogenase